MNINNNTNNRLNNLNTTNLNNQKNQANEFLQKTQQTNNDIISSIIDSRKENSEIFRANLGNRNVQNLITSLQSCSNSLKDAHTVLKNLKTLYLNLNSSNFSFDKVQNLTEKTSIVIKQLKFIAKNTTHEEKPLLSGRNIEYNVYIKNKPETLKLNFVSLLKIASTLEDIKINNADSLNEAIETINKYLVDIDKSNRKIDSMNKKLESVLDYYNRNNSNIKNSKQALKILQNCKNALLGNEKESSFTGIFKNITSNKKTEKSFVKEENLVKKEDFDIEDDFDINKELNTNLVEEDVLASEEDIKKASDALKNLVVYDDDELLDDKSDLFKEGLLKNEKEVKKENVFVSFDENTSKKNNETDSTVSDILKKISENQKEVKNEENENKIEDEYKVDEKFVALLTGKNPNKTFSKYIWTAFYASLGVSFLVLVLSNIKK